ncbi:MAG: aminomethyl-transferring glycine dehydrogenase subunit GcvPA [Thaumarchaeota archaeon]|nr:aminomethyl-transferring glycine dehydrogenase subunit GcvPA [Nitrososphaerota archaeon]
MSGKKIVFPYIPNSVPDVKRQMLKAVKAKHEMDLYEEIPERLRVKRRLRLPKPILDESSLRRHVEGILQRNGSGYLSFLGAGCAEHFVPAVCDEINGRGEFLTAYGAASYADHGKWQAYFEYCSLMGELLDMDILSLPLYDGGQAAATSLRMASRMTGRKEVVVPRALNPEVGLVIKNYLKPDITINEAEYDRKTGTLDLKKLRSKISSKTAAVLIENPTYLGLLEADAAEIGRMARSAGAEFIVYTDPISLGVLSPPAKYGATFACGDFQPLGLHLNTGGGQGGFIATHDDMRYISQFKEELYGITPTIEPGEYGFDDVLYNRTAYGSREKGNEYTGTANGLWAITVAVYLSLMGPKGMQDTGRTIMQMSQYAAKRLSTVKGVRLRFQGPFFKEFVLDFNRSGKSVAAINRALLKERIIGGKDLSKELPELGQSSLYCVTEMRTQADIDRLAGAMEEVL